jgi:acetolactate synthase-1/2/3 large subunit
MNNGLMGGYGEYMPDADDRNGSNQLGGGYAEVGTALGAYSERVADPAELQAGLQRCIASVESGRTALLEVMTHEEPTLALP